MCEKGKPGRGGEGLGLIGSFRRKKIS